MLKHFFPAVADGSIAYLDNAATTQMPRAVLDAMVSFEERGRANIHRGLYPWAEHATVSYEAARADVAKLVGAAPEQLAFTRGTTEGLNIAAQHFAGQLGPGDEVLVSSFEHHANLFPWQRLARQRGFAVRVIDPFACNGQMSDRTKVVALTAVSNVTGEALPLREIVAKAKAVGARVVVDAAQAVGHMGLDLATLGVDALAWSAHKMYGPMGIGALVYAREHIEHVKPWLVGGGIVDSVALDGEAAWVRGMRALEAGTPYVTGAIGFATAARWLIERGVENISSDERRLLAHLKELLERMPAVRMLPVRGDVTSMVSLMVNGVHAHDVAEALGRSGVAVRAGYLCAAPFVKSCAPEGVVRISLAASNDEADILRCTEALADVSRLFASYG